MDKNKEQDQAIDRDRRAALKKLTALGIGAIAAGLGSIATQALACEGKSKTEKNALTSRKKGRSSSAGVTQEPDREGNRGQRRRDWDQIKPGTKE